MMKRDREREGKGLRDRPDRRRRRRKDQLFGTQEKEGDKGEEGGASHPSSNPALPHLPDRRRRRLPSLAIYKGTAAGADFRVCGRKREKVSRPQGRKKRNGHKKREKSHPRKDGLFFPSRAHSPCSSLSSSICLTLVAKWVKWVSATLREWEAKKERKR